VPLNVRLRAERTLRLVLDLLEQLSMLLAINFLRLPLNVILVERVEAGALVGCEVTALRS